jgi:hypothetical protein
VPANRKAVVYMPADSMDDIKEGDKSESILFLKEKKEML